MECLVTGAAGFIGSHLCERLLRDGHQVLGIDCFTTYYDREIKERNLRGLLNQKRFDLIRVDLSKDDLDGLSESLEAVFHLAAMPGLPRSWTDYELYQRHNILGTQRLLSAVRDLPKLKRFIYVSTSSVYGKNASGDEQLPLRPCSPYGVTKLAGEHLARVYAEEFGVPAVVLRYFSVYGPRQRPDMAYHRFIQAALEGRPIPLYGDGLQMRGNTYVGDCVEGTIAALNAIPGETFNLGGGEIVSMRDVLRKLERLLDRPITIQQHPERVGDQRHTGADITKIVRHLGWQPRVSLDEGLERQIAWHREALLRQAA